MFNKSQLESPLVENLWAQRVNLLAIMLHFLPLIDINMKTASPMTASQDSENLLRKVSFNQLSFRPTKKSNETLP